MVARAYDSYIETLTGGKTEDFAPRKLLNKPEGFREAQRRNDPLLFAHVQTPRGGSEFRPLTQFTRLPPLNEIHLFSSTNKNSRLSRDDPAVVEEIRRQRASQRLGAEEAERDPLPEGGAYHPEGADRRQVVERQIRVRRGQQQFRDALRSRYGDRCLVTGSEIVALLEAAHIRPYRGDNDNHPANGLLLRADIHTLFDLDLLGIEPIRLLVELHPAILREYGHLAGNPLRCPEAVRPSREALKTRFQQFCRRKEDPA